MSLNSQEQRNKQEQAIRKELTALGWSEKGIYRKLTIEFRAGHACAYSGFDMVTGSIEPMYVNRTARDNASRFHIRINMILTKQKQFCGRITKIAPTYDPAQKWYFVATFPPELNGQGWKDELVLRTEYHAAKATDLLTFYPFPDAMGGTV